MTSTPSPSVALLDGHWVEHEDLTLSAFDSGFLQGVTAVERLRTYQGKVFELPAHLSRWRNTIAELGIEGLPLDSAMHVLVDQLIGRNRAFLEQVGDVGLCWFATPGRSEGQPTFGMYLLSIDHQRVAKHRQQGQRLVVTEVLQPPPDSWSRAIKTRCRLHYYLADRIASESCPGALGILLDQDQTVTDTSVANLAIVESGAIVSPPSDRVLGGITQQAVQKLASQLGIVWQHQPIDQCRLGQADEILLMGTTGGLWYGRLSETEKSPDSQSVYGRLLEQFERLVSGAPKSVKL